MVSDGKWVGNVSIDFSNHGVAMKKDQSSFDEVEYFGGLDDSTWSQLRSLHVKKAVVNVLISDARRKVKRLTILT